MVIYVNDTCSFTDLKEGDIFKFNSDCQPMVVFNKTIESVVGGIKGRYTIMHLQTGKIHTYKINKDTEKVKVLLLVTPSKKED